MAEQAKNKSFTDVLNSICTKPDPALDPMVIVVAVGQVTKSEVKQFMTDLQASSPDETRFQRFMNCLRRKIRKNCGFNEAEELSWQKARFWSRLLYLLPEVTEKPTKVESLSQSPPSLRLKKKIKMRGKEKGQEIAEKDNEAQKEKQKEHQLNQVNKLIFIGFKFSYQSLKYGWILYFFYCVFTGFYWCNGN